MIGLTLPQVLTNEMSRPAENEIFLFFLSTDETKIGFSRFPHSSLTSTSSSSSLSEPISLHFVIILFVDQNALFKIDILFALLIPTTEVKQKGSLSDIDSMHRQRL